MSATVTVPASASTSATRRTCQQCGTALPEPAQSRPGPRSRYCGKACTDRAAYLRRRRDEAKVAADRTRMRDYARTAYAALRQTAASTASGNKKPKHKKATASASTPPPPRPAKPRGRSGKSKQALASTSTSASAASSRGRSRSRQSTTTTPPPLPPPHAAEEDSAAAAPAPVAILYCEACHDYTDVPSATILAACLEPAQAHTPEPTLAHDGCPAAAAKGRYPTAARRPTIHVPAAMATSLRTSAAVAAEARKQKAAS